MHACIVVSLSLVALKHVLRVLYECGKRVGHAIRARIVCMCAHSSGTIARDVTVSIDATSNQPPQVAGGAPSGRTRPEGFVRPMMHVARPGILHKDQPPAKSLQDTAGALEIAEFSNGAPGSSVIHLTSIRHD